MAFAQQDLSDFDNISEETKNKISANTNTRLFLKTDEVEKRQKEYLIIAESTLDQYLDSCSILSILLFK